MKYYKSVVTYGIPIKIQKKWFNYTLHPSVWNIEYI